jgi:hypothetical protein
MDFPQSENGDTWRLIEMQTQLPDWNILQSYSTFLTKLVLYGSKMFLCNTAIYRIMGKDKSSLKVKTVIGYSNTMKYGVNIQSIILCRTSIF